MRHARYAVANYFVRMAMDGETISVFGDGQVMRDYLYIDDAVDAFIRAADAASIDSRVYNVGRSEPTTLIELVDEIILAAGSGAWEFAPYTHERKAQEPGDFYSDISRIGDELRWKPTTDLSDGLRQTVEFYEANSSHYWDRSGKAVTV
jgi:UDP-glucose 4-epimerase